MEYAIGFILGVLALAALIFICWAFSTPMSSSGR